MTNAPNTSAPGRIRAHTVSATPDPRETIWSQWPLMKRLRRRVVAPFYRLADTGLFGLTPLDTHVAICGYPRSGTTLLLAMMEYGFPKARRFGEEVGAWRAATYAWRNHAVIVSKKPDDLFVIHRIRNFYAGRKAKLRVILMVRDPRDVLTSRHVVTGPAVYFQDIGDWRQRHQAVRHFRNDPEVMLLYYQDLVTNTAEVCRRIEQFTGLTPERPMEEFHKAKMEGFDTRALNGVRPVDNKTVGRWRGPEHRERIEQILREVPDFCEILVEMGWEKDDSWVEQWRAEVGAA